MGRGNKFYFFDFQFIQQCQAVIVKRGAYIICITGRLNQTIYNQLIYLHNFPFPSEEFSWLQPYHCEGQVQ